MWTRTAKQSGQLPWVGPRVDDRRPLTSWFQDVPDGGMSRSLLNCSAERERGSGDGRLRDLLLGVQLLAIECADECGISPQPRMRRKLLPRLLQPGGDPAHEHAAVAPASHVADEVADEAVEVLDRVGASAASGRARRSRRDVGA